MREFLFKGKFFKWKEDGESQEFYHGSLLCEYYDYGGDQYYIINNFNGERTRIDTETICQYTGYKVGHEEVYENDILYLDNTKEKIVVKWLDRAGMWFVEGLTNGEFKYPLNIVIYVGDAEIIGNIHDKEGGNNNV